MFFDWKRRCEMKELPQKHCDCVQGLHLGSITIDLVCVFSLSFKSTMTCYYYYC